MSTTSTRLLVAFHTLRREDVFTLKGATAINLFNRDMQRLSVDIDLINLLTN